ncbi:hypothetical protein WB865_001853 [Vibrio vulnificus]
MERDSWGIFHDGYISKIEGTIPGELRVFVNILYLRGMFQGDGEGFVVTLSNCTMFEYQEYDEQPTRNLKDIEGLEPEVLYVQSKEPLVLDCSAGTLRMSYDSATIEIDNGTPVTDNELSQECDNYWEGWKKCNEENS